MKNLFTGTEKIAFSSGVIFKVSVARRYLNERLKKKKQAIGHDDVEVESVSDGEFDKFLGE